MAKILFLFTSNYPFGTGETFIENEMGYLAEAFDKIVIVSNDLNQTQTRVIPTNVVVKRLSYELSFSQKLLSFSQIFHPLFWQEVNIIRNTYKQKITRPILNTMLQTLQKASVFYPYLKRIRKEFSQPEDQVYLYSYWNNDMAFALAHYKELNPKVKTLSRMHRWDVYFEESKINYLPFRNYLFNALDRVFSISEDGITYTDNKLKKRIEKLTLSRLGVKQAVARNPASGEKLHLLSISNLIPVKALERLIQALSMLSLDFYWTHIGDGPLRKELEILASEIICERFEFKGNLKNQEVMEYLQNCSVDLFINVSLSEGIPVSIMEAMSFGIPVLASTVGGTPEIVNNENGFLLSGNPTPNEIAVKITEFFSLTKEQKELKRKAAYLTWAEEYNAEKNYNYFINELLTL